MTTIMISIKYAHSNCDWIKFCKITGLEPDMHINNEVVEISIDEADSIGVWSAENQKQRLESQKSLESRKRACQELIDEMNKSLLEVSTGNFQNKYVPKSCKECVHKTLRFEKMAAYRLRLKKWDKSVYCGRYKKQRDCSYADRCTEYALDSEKKNALYDRHVAAAYKNLQFVEIKDLNIYAQN